MVGVGLNLMISIKIGGPVKISFLRLDPLNHLILWNFLLKTKKILEMMNETFKKNTMKKNLRWKPNSI